jgi:hypothetical protein
MRLALAALLAFALAAAIGLGATWWTIAHGLPAAGLVIGPWRAEPTAGTLAAHAYLRAAAAQRGEAPLAYGDGLAFMAERDDEGRPLAANCAYRLEGDMPAARIWTLALFDPAGAALNARRSDDSLSSAEAIRFVDTPLVITLSKEVQPGNWLPLQSDGAFMLGLSLYDTSIGTPLDRASPGALLSIKRGACR